MCVYRACGGKAGSIHCIALLHHTRCPLRENPGSQRNGMEHIRYCRLGSCDSYEERYKTKERCDRKALLAATAAQHKVVVGSHFSCNAITSKGLYQYPYVSPRPLLGISGICMMHAIIFLWAALIAGRAHAAAVFAHFLVRTIPEYSSPVLTNCIGIKRS
jgi:hypothetical protein